MSKPNAKPLIFNIFDQCKTTKARVGRMTLPHGDVDTPVFMPVGTQVGRMFKTILDCGS